MGLAAINLAHLILTKNTPQNLDRGWTKIDLNIKAA